MVDTAMMDSASVKKKMIGRMLDVRVWGGERAGVSDISWMEIE